MTIKKWVHGPIALYCHLAYGLLEDAYKLLSCNFEIKIRTHAFALCACACFLQFYCIYFGCLCCLWIKNDYFFNCLCEIKLLKDDVTALHTSNMILLNAFLFGWI